MIRHVAANLWTLDGADVQFAGAPTNTRMTVIRLTDGRLWVHSPIPRSPAIDRFIESFDTQVCALVAPNKYHHLWISDWQAQYPSAAVFAEPKAKQRNPALSNATDLSDRAPSLYAQEIDQVIIAGNPFYQEVAFFHKPTRTALFTDLFINRSVAGLTFWPRTYLKLEGVVAPRGGIPRLYKYTTLNRRAARVSAAKIKAWQPRRLLFSHSEDFAEPAVEVIEREFAFLNTPLAVN